MKIVIITPFWLPTKGGITTVVYNLYNELKLKGVPVYILTPDKGEEAIIISKNKFFMILDIIKFLHKIKPDVIHVHAHGSLLLPAVLYKILFNSRQKVIFTFHTQPQTFSYIKGKPTKERNLVQLYLLNLLLRKCDYTTCVAKSLRDSLNKTGVKLINSVIIPNGVSIKNVSQEELLAFKHLYNLESNYPILGMVANLSWDWKIEGIKILIKAFKEVLTFESKARLLIIGDGQYRKYLEDYVENKMNLKGKIIFTGNMENPFIALSILDIYCHISLNEALGIAPLEAMSIGKPVIASNTGGLPEFIENGFNGILVDSKPDSIANAILRLIKNPSLVSWLSKNAVETTRLKFSWEKITTKYLELYEN